jgi:hypothetical protein
MEDDVEVELELEKQLALAHELFPANFRKVDPYFRCRAFYLFASVDSHPCFFDASYTSRGGLGKIGAKFNF